MLTKIFRNCLKLFNKFAKHDFTETVLPSLNDTHNINSEPSEVFKPCKISFYNPSLWNLIIDHSHTTTDNYLKSSKTKRHLNKMPLPLYLLFSKDPQYDQVLHEMLSSNHDQVFHGQ